MTWLFIEPGDVWSFRDNRPLLTGNITECVFPPTPLTVQGAIRALILGSSGVDWKDFKERDGAKAEELGEMIGFPAYEEMPAELGAFSMGGPFLAKRKDGKVMFYAPMPADVRQMKDCERKYFTLWPSCQYCDFFTANWPAALHPLWPPKEYETEGENVEDEIWLDAENLNKYLNGKGCFIGMEAEEFFESEPRLGIALDYGRRHVRESMLYQINFVRPKKDVGLLVHLADEVKMPDGDHLLLRLGGEARSAHYESVNDNHVVPNTKLENATQRLKIVFATPAYFDGGWQPLGGDAAWSALLGLKVKLISASLGRPQRIGGWDVSKGWHKPIHHYVPAGSVYFFKAEEAVSELPMINNGGMYTITQTPEGELPFDRLGFGRFMLGKWNWLELQGEKHVS